MLSKDPQLEHFLRKGFLLIPPGSSSPELHQAIYAKASAINAKGPEETWRLADGVLAAIPELNHVIEMPQVQQALTAILGEHYMLHGHRHLHVSGAASQMWHKDSYWGLRKIRKHRPRWCMLLYYPQETVLSMGPTCILSGSQYWTKDTEHMECGEDILLPNSQEQSMFLPHGNMQYQTGVLNEAKSNYLAQYAGLVEDLALTVPAGSCVLMHYDLFHRASCRLNGTAPVRFLVKFQFLRTVEPSPSQTSSRMVVNQPSWKLPPNVQLDPIVKDISAWMAGTGAAKASMSLSERARRLEELQRSTSEVERLAAAYSLGQVGARQALTCALLEGSEATCRAAAYGLVASGPEAAHHVLRLLKSHQSVPVHLADLPQTSRLRRFSAFVLGECARPEPQTIRALGEALREEFCTEALGEMLEALGLIAARARAMDQEELCHLCMQQVLPFLDTPIPKCQVGEGAAYAILLAAGPRGQAPPHVLAHLAQVVDSPDHILGSFALEVLRRAGHVPCRPRPGRPRLALREAPSWGNAAPMEQHPKIRKLCEEDGIFGDTPDTPQTCVSLASLASSPSSPWVGEAVAHSAMI